jgi:hypothetical protein
MVHLLAKRGTLARWKQDDLMTLWYEVRCSPVRAARVLFPTRPKGYVSATYGLANYACNLSVMRTCKAKKDRNGTKCYQHAMDLCVTMMPGLGHRYLGASK